MRNLIVRTASTGEVMAIVVFGEEDTPRIEALMSHVAERFPQITSLFYVVNTKWNDSLADLTPVLYRGKDHILEQMEGLRFKVGPKSFYQTNSAQAYELYKVARDFAALTGGETLYDLYTGTGTIANFCAARRRATWRSWTAPTASKRYSPSTCSPTRTTWRTWSNSCGDSESRAFGQARGLLKTGHQQIIIVARSAQ